MRSLPAAFCLRSPLAFALAACTAAALAQAPSPSVPPPTVPTLVERTAAPAPGQGAATSNAAPVNADEPAYRSDSKFQKALAQAKAPRQTAEDLLANWKHANKIANGACVECMEQVLVLQMHVGAYKDAVGTAQQLKAIATSPKDKVLADAQMGNALMRYNYGQPKPEQLAQAEIALHEALQSAPRARDVMFLEGRALAMLGRNDEAKAMFERYADIVPASDKLRLRAERFAEDPHLATLQMAPPFRMVTSDGQQLELDDMNGKVVLLDFWATWCGPCKETLPEVARIARDYKDDPMVVVISVSQDRDESAWKTFVQKNNMSWPQYRDANNALGLAYGVNAIPHFFTIDTNGVLRTEQVGSQADVHVVVSDLVKKAHKAEAQRARASDRGASQ